jgi:hypothetical protein
MPPYIANPLTRETQKFCWKRSPCCRFLSTPSRSRWTCQCRLRNFRSDADHAHVGRLQYLRSPLVLRLPWVAF